MKESSISGNKKVVICISGMTGSGKSTVARRIAEKYGLDYFSGGNAMRALAQEEGYNSEVNGWWESGEGLEFLKQRMNDPTFDRRIDEKLVELGKKGNVVLDSWTVPWLLDDGFKVWLESSETVRAQRVVKRDNISFEEALAALKEKDAQTRQIYKNLYGFDLGLDLSPFNLVLTTDDLEPDEVFYAVALVTDRLVFGKQWPTTS
ncbi:MAG: cytidylate kinase family protein [Candidatus Bathyarchaeota archaeon]|nr:cytidylate kinase family protein [Candidatus Bathyarchaeota archaeon]